MITMYIQIKYLTKKISIILFDITLVSFHSANYIDTFMK